MTKASVLLALGSFVETCCSGPDVHHTPCLDLPVKTGLSLLRHLCVHDIAEAYHLCVIGTFIATLFLALMVRMSVICMQLSVVLNATTLQ